MNHKRSLRPYGLELRIMVFVLSIILASLFIIHPVYAVCDAAEMNKPVDQRSADCPAGLDQFEAIVGNVISVIVGLGFIAMLVMVIMAGIKYLTSGGEPKAIQSAHQTLAWALLGLLFFALAWIILQLIHAFTGIDVTVFDIKTLCKLAGDPDPLKFCK